MAELDTFVIFSAIYDSVEPAHADYETIKALYYEEHLVDTFDAAVLTKDEHGKVKIVSKHEQPLRQGAWAGGTLGLAAGVVVAIFPPVALGAAALWGTGVGLGLGAWAGHAAFGMSRSDLKDLGEQLDEGEAALVAVAAAAVADRVEASLKQADKIARKELKADRKAAEKEAAEAAKQAG